MKRNIQITIDPSIDRKNVVHINNLSSIINHSCDSIILDILEYLRENDHSTVVRLLLEKLRPFGKLIILFSNCKNIAQNYIDSAISSSDFLNFFTNKQSLLSVESVYTLIDFQQFDISNIDISSNRIVLEIERKNI